MRKMRWVGRTIAGLTLALGLVAMSAPEARAFGTSMVVEGDQLILKDGRIVEGELIEETETSIRFLVKVGSISAEQTYAKSDVLAIERGDEAGDEPKTDAAAPKTSDPSRPATGGDGPVVYVMELSGVFQTDITVQSIEKMVADAKKYRPDYLVLVMDNRWEIFGQELPEDVGFFDSLFYTEEIEPILTTEIPKDWGYTPEYIVWVKNAMGGLCFLPLNFKTIYFHSKGRLGGVGDLIHMFGSTGDERVREKQFSLRLGVARGMAIHGGYDPRLAMALAREDFVLSYRMNRGVPELLERMPEGPGELLLTDNGAGENGDTIDVLARGQGNDTLTLKADNALDLRVSKGTVDTLTDLLREEGLARDATVIEENSRRIIESWSDSVVRAQRSLFDLIRDFSEIQVQGDYSERTRARGLQIRKLEQVMSIMNRFEGVSWPFEPGAPYVPQFVPPQQQLEIMIEQIRQEQLRDKR